MGHMAVKKENLDLDAETARRRPIELVTENGFSIVRVADLDEAAARSTGAYVFLVQDPNNQETEIAVEIDPRFRNEIGLRSLGRLSTTSSYWICRAERHLAAYLWENDEYPPDATLRVEDLTLDDINLSHRWDRDSWEEN
jgi:hypothetical protein